MTGPATPAAPKVPATPKTPASPIPEFLIDDHYGLALAMLALGVVVGVGIYYLLTHVTVEDDRA